MSRYVLPDGITPVFRERILIKQNKRDELRLRTKREKQRFYDLYRRYFTIRRSVVRLRQHTRAYGNLREFPVDLFTNRSFALPSRSSDVLATYPSCYEAPAFFTQTDLLLSKFEKPHEQPNVDDVHYLVGESNDLNKNGDILFPPSSNIAPNGIKTPYFGPVNINRFVDPQRTGDAAYMPIDGLTIAAIDNTENDFVERLVASDDVMTPYNIPIPKTQSKQQPSKLFDQYNFADVSLNLPASQVSGGMNKLAYDLPESLYMDSQIAPAEENSLCKHILTQ